MIKQRTIGRTGLKVSELCLGTMNFGWKTDEPKSFAILDAYHEAGGNFLQGTGHCPAPTLPAASTEFSEEVVGRWWQSRMIPRDRLILATRVSLGQALPPDVPLAHHIRSYCEDSLQRLQTDYLNILILEWSDALLPIHETLDAFDALIRGGLVRYVGAANFPVWRVADAIGRAHMRNQSRMELLQSDYSLMTRARFEPEAMSLCQEQRLGFLARSPLAGGFLTNRSSLSDQIKSSRREWLEQRFGNAYGDAGLAAVGEVAVRHGASPAQISLAWVLSNSGVTSAVVGVNSPDQLGELVGASRLELTHRDLADLAHATAAEEVQVPASHLANMA